mgnify:CR=1 FL=1
MYPWIRSSRKLKPVEPSVSSAIDLQVLEEPGLLAYLAGHLLDSGRITWVACRRPGRGSMVVAG